MRHVEGRRLLLLCTLTLAACGGGAASSEDSTSSPDAAFALAVCEVLREQTNQLARVANRAVAGIEAKAPADRFTAILDGFDEARRAAESFVESAAAIELPNVAERDDVRQQIVGGARVAVGELEDERARFELTGPTVADGDTHGRVGEFFNSIEKAMSVIEPTIAGYKRTAFRRAFLDEPACKYVIQPFQLDG